MTSIPPDPSYASILPLVNGTNGSPLRDPEGSGFGDRSPHSPVAVESRVINYVPWKLHTQVTLECDIDSIPHLGQPTPTIEHKDWVRPESNRQRPFHLPTMTTLASGKQQITMYVERLLSRTVAMVADCQNVTDPTSPRWVVKFYPSDFEARWRLKQELEAYEACEALHGAEVPVFYGQWEISEAPAGACSALLMEFVSPGRTVNEIREEFKLLPEGVEKRKARLRLAHLHSSATRAVDRINESKVVQCNLRGENMLAADGWRGTWCGVSVVIVDFAHAMVMRDGVWTDYEHSPEFHRAFMMGDSSWQDGYWY